MSAGSNSSRSQKNSLAQRAERSAGRANNHAADEETFHQKGPVAGAFGAQESDPEAVFKEHNPDVPPDKQPPGEA